MNDAAVSGLPTVSGVLAYCGGAAGGWQHLLEALLPAITAAAAALFGVWLANRSSARQLAAQLDVAAREATRAREFEARRDVYLDAAEAIATGQSVIGVMLDVTISEAEIRENLTACLGKLAKVNVIARSARCAQSRTTRVR
jgi:hypothetical protein